MEDEKNSKIISKADSKIDPKVDPKADPKADLTSLRSNYQNCFQDKENFNSQRKEVTTKIRSLIDEVKSRKQSRTSLNNDVHELKKKRDILHSKIKEIIEEVKKLSQLKSDKLKSTKKDEGKDPHQIKMEIERLETKFETEALPFNKEKEINKKIKDLKKDLEKLKETGNTFEQYNVKNKELRDIKREAQKVHEEIQKKAKESEKHHQDIVSISKKVDELKIQEEDYAQKFKAKKKECISFEKELKSALGQAALNKAKEQAEKKKKEEHKEKKKKENVAKKVELVKQKLKRGEKLNTEDLIILQSEQD